MSNSSIWLLMWEKGHYKNCNCSVFCGRTISGTNYYSKQSTVYSLSTNIELPLGIYLLKTDFTGIWNLLSLISDPELSSTQFTLGEDRILKQHSKNSLSCSTDTEQETRVCGHKSSAPGDFTEILVLCLVHKR